MRKKKLCVGLLTISTFTAIVVRVLALADEGEPSAPLGSPVDLTSFDESTAIVEAELAKDQSGRYSREDLLVKLGRSSAAAGNFEVAAAAYLTFLHEFGPDHPYV